MTARDAFGRLFKAIGEFHRSTVEQGRRAGAEMPIARTVFRSHRDGQGFTIDGSLRPGQPTRKGDEDNGAFIGLRSGHALQSVKDWAKRRGFPDETITKFDRLDDLLDYIHDPVGTRDA